jgi:hypothetical protein
MRYTVYSVCCLAAILFFLSTLTACSGGRYTEPGSREALPDPDDKTAWNARYSPSEYITAWGFSNQSMQQAEQDAKAQVAASVRSSIESEMVSVMESESASGGEIRDYQKLESRTTTTAHFDHAEMIRLVPPTAHESKGEFWVMASLSRREAVEELLIPYNSEAIRFRFLAARLDSLQKDPPNFTITWKELNERHQLMAPAAAEVRAVAGRNLPEMAADEALFRGAEARRLALLGNLKTVVVLREHPDLDHDELFSRISSALTSLGLSVVGDECRTGSMILEFQPDLKWTNVMGRVVQLELAGEVGLCDQEEPWNLFSLRGEHMRGEGRQPIRDLLARMTPQLLKDDLQGILDPYLPF